MNEIPEEIRKEIQSFLECERLEGYSAGRINGEVEGALNVLYALDMDKATRLEILSKAVFLSRHAAREFLEPREIKERIYKSGSMPYKDKVALNALMNHPEQTWNSGSRARKTT